MTEGDCSSTGVVDSRGTVPPVEFEGPGLRRDRPYSASMISRKSVTSTKSQTSLKAGVVTTDYSKAHLFSCRDGSFDKAIDKCKEMIYKEEMDGEMKGAWLLTVIDHWDHERENLIILGEFSLLVVSFDFITFKVLKWDRIFLHRITELKFGDLVYPPKSLMPLREHGGLRIAWGAQDGLSFSQKWNPWASDIPYLTLSHHPCLYNPKEHETVTFNVDELCDYLRELIPKAHAEKSTGKECVVLEEPILIESYASMSSLIFNQSHLGFNLDRNGVNF
ncbi:hypothetical protein CAPTEDRAFT_163000 [Capitella teleta]|uniref:HSac2 domain-containing protein n=1 Tax=Capitella teleta TaxID=283909 RepID=R7URW2_CAPTE|nr:hypothetical protein CAPTEDRAFT_163000 [Capitella teleta]|eukprot:ELU06121.1 hypothetical protein CAPTEDRAFT_163000 [Capitella teleta]